MASASTATFKWRVQDIERVLIVVFYGYFCAIILLEVILRYGFGASTPWGEMTARYAFVYLVSIAAAEAARHNNHIRIDLVPRLIGDRARLYLYLYFDVLQLVLGALIIFYAIKVMGIQIANQQMMQTLDFNMAIAYFALPFGWGLFILRVGTHMAKNIGIWRERGQVPLGGEGVTE